MSNIYKVYRIMLLLQITVISVTSLTLASCASESELNNDSQGDIALKINMQVPSQTNVSTRTTALSGNESTVNNLTALIFNSSNQLIGYGYSASPTSTGTNIYQMTVNTREATGCTVYVVANAGANAFSGVNTVDEFKKQSVTLSAASDLGVQSSTIMQGVSTTSQDITSSTETFATTVPLYRLCTKVNFNIIPANNITITGYQLHEVPTSSYIADHSAETTPAYNPSGSYKDFAAITESSPTAGNEVTDTYYIYENLAGKVTASNTAKARNSINAPATASYLDLYATGTNWKSTYRIYLGGTGTTDYTNYNIPRNYNYTYTINITGSGIYDVRVTCYPELINSSTAGTWNNNGSATAVTSSATANIGDYYYSDGTWGSLANNPGKTPIGVVFSKRISSEEQSAGYVHGYAMALNNVSGTYTWGPYDSETSIPDIQTVSSYYNDLNSGYLGANTYGMATSTYPAFLAAKNYSNTVAAPANSGGWRLPSWGQWCDVLTNLGSIGFSSSSNNSYDIYSTGTAESNIDSYFTAAGGSALYRSWYWTASEYSSKYAGGIHFQTSMINISYYEKYNGYYVRPIVAF